MICRSPKSSYEWDVVVIGAGPAGSSAAQEAAKAGCRTLVLERRRHVGVPVQCAEYVPLAVSVEAPQSCWAQRVEGMLTFVEGRLAAESRWPGVVLHRDLFDQALVTRAVQAGARLLTGCQVERVEGSQVTFRQQGVSRKASARILIGADGPLSLTGRSIGLRQRAFVYGLQVRAHLARPLSHTEVHFRPEFLGGYGWVFPKREAANVGIGVLRSQAHRLPELLLALLTELSESGVLKANSWSKLTGGLVPVGGPPEKTVRGGLLLVGDAAGQTDPVTGGGIPNAILCGRLAGQVAAQALKEGRLDGVGRYEEIWREMIWPSLERALKHRQAMEEGWQRVPFEHLIGRHWVAFRDYFLGAQGERAWHRD